MNDKSAIPDPHYSWVEGLAVALALSQRCITELRALARTPGPEGKRGPAGNKGDRGERGEIGKQGPAGLPGQDGLDGKPGVRGDKGERGETGLEGPQGAPGEPGPVGPASYVGRACGLWNATESYLAMDVVAHNGSEWRAVRDDPGPLPGDGWVLGAKGSRGKPGERGDKGERGPQGPPGLSVVRADMVGFELVLTMSDASVLVCNLQPAFEHYHREAVA